MIQAGVKKYTVPTGGGTVTINTADLTDVFTDYLFVGTGTLSSSYTITTSGTPSQAIKIRILYFATMTLGGNNVTVLGTPLSAEQALKGAVIIEGVYDVGAGVWRVAVLDSTTITPSNYEGVKERALVSGGEMITLSALVDKEFQYITGDISLAGNYSFEPTGTFKDGHHYYFKFGANVIANGNTFTIFGVSLSENQMLVGNLTVFAYYDLASTSWITQLYQDPAFIFENTEAITVPLSFETNEQGDNTVYIPYGFKLTTIAYTVTKAIAGTDDATITPLINGTPTTPSTITIAASTAINTAASVTITASNTGSGVVNAVKLVTAKTTAGGKVIASLFLKRIPV